MRAPSSCIVVALAIALASIASACRDVESPKPVGSCIDSCNALAGKRCSEQECTRGCTFILDRLVERESATVLACVAKASEPCDDGTWAACAVRVGEHADGGPPPPPPPPED